jgi:hypothetical protein
MAEAKNIESLVKYDTPILVTTSSKRDAGKLPPVKV